VAIDQLNLKHYIRDVPDWPKKGILFRDITPLLAHADAFDAAVDAMIDCFADRRIDCVAAVEARGFIFGAAIAQKLGVGFVPIRKKGKLPYRPVAVSYELEYGQDTIEIHADGVSSGANVLLVDDLLATGGTMAAACELIEKIGGKVVGVSFLIELSALEGARKLTGYDHTAVIRY
jgi:adenine phosphoribosyltransferase